MMENLKQLVTLTAKMSEELKALTLSYQALDCLPNPIVITDKDGSIRWVNKNFEKQTGYSLKEVSGLNPRVLKSGSHDAEFYKNMWDTIRDGKTWHGHIVNKYKDGSLHNELMTITPIKQGDTVNFFVAVKQLTD